MSGKTHRLRIWPEHFGDVLEGRKRAEIRENDRNFQVADLLVLQEFEPSPEISKGSGIYTGRELCVEVTHVSTFAQAVGWCVLSIRPVSALDEDGEPLEVPE